MIVCTILLLREGFMILPSHSEETHSDMGKGAGAGWSELCERHVVNVTPVRSSVFDLKAKG